MTVATEFLPGETLIPWESERKGFESRGVVIGEGSDALEIVVGETQGRATKNLLQRVWKDRRSGRVNPILVVGLYGDDDADVCGPSGESPHVFRNLRRDQAARICRSALEKPDRHAARRFLWDVLTQADEDLVGIRNQGLVSKHVLKNRVPNQPGWDEAIQQARDILDEEGKGLVGSLGYGLERHRGTSYVLTDEGRETAVAVLLEEDELFDQRKERFSGDSPVAYGLTLAKKKNVDYVILASGRTLRLYTTDPEAGFGSRGLTDTYVEINADLLDEDTLGYLWLLFSASALRSDGSLHEILRDSEDYATGLGRRLRQRVYDDVLPDLAQAIAEARGLEDIDRDKLDETYQMALVQLYRLLFIAYAEDEGLLPRRENSRYKRRSLKAKAHELHELASEGVAFDERSTTHWDDVRHLVKAVHNGHAELGLPEYDGQLLSSDPEVSEAGGQLAEVELTDDAFGPVLLNLLVDETEDGYEGPVDFQDIGVREFGVIYEGLLESELSIADDPLQLVEKDDVTFYVPTDDPGTAHVAEGELYLHGLSGERKATGTFYTRKRFVEHLLEHSLEPALDAHLERLAGMSKREAEEAFFDFRVADIAMGSGHFLVAAVDRIEGRFTEYLQERPLPGVQEELLRLKEAAIEAFGSEDEAPEIERNQLLRRQIARRCVYGVDVNDLATQLARLSLWIHTFVPGLPLTFLDYNLTTGDSLAGIGTFAEVSEILDTDQKRLDAFFPYATAVEELSDKIDELGRTVDADAQQVRAARETRSEIEEGLAPVRQAFDILAASRIDEEVDPEVVRSGGDLEGTDACQQAHDALAAVDQLHFPTAFPDVFRRDKPGFDVIVGNPPWEEATLEEDEFWMRYEPGLQGRSQTEQERIKAKLREERPDLVEKYEKENAEQAQLREILRNGPYPGIGTGDPDTYKAFYWRFWNLVREEGHVGVVLPRGAFVAAGSEEFRRTLLTEGIVEDLTFIKNKARWAFDMEPRYTFGLVGFRKRPPDGEGVLKLRGPFPDAKSFEAGTQAAPHEFPATQALSWTDSAAFPVLPPTPAAMPVFLTMAKHPGLDLDEEGEWRARPYRELDASTEKEKDDGTTLMHFTEDPPEDFWPVFKGGSFDIWETDTGVRYAWADPEVMLDYLQDGRERSYRYAGKRSAFYEMPEEWVKDPATQPCLSARVAFRDVSRSTDTRTVRAALVRPRVFLTNKAPYFLWPRGNERDEAYLLGVLCSIPLDWWARRFVETNLNYHILHGFRIPRPGDGSILRERVVELAGRLAAADDRYDEWADAVGVEYGPLDEEEKKEMIHELDAVVAHLFGLSEDHLETVFETFHRGWDHKPRLSAVLSHYKEWEARLRD